MIAIIKIQVGETVAEVELNVMVFSTRSTRKGWQRTTTIATRESVSALISWFLCAPTLDAIVKLKLLSLWICSGVFRSTTICSGLWNKLGILYDLTYWSRVPSDGPCDKDNLPENGIKNAKVTGYKWILSNSDSEVQTAASSRVLSVAVHASTMFAYRSGIFTGCPDSTQDAVINHAMIITGYTPKTWILKNR